jgi:hypothetical protein
VRSGSPKPLVTVNTAPFGTSFDAYGNFWQGDDGNTLSEWSETEVAKLGSRNHG